MGKARNWGGHYSRRYSPRGADAIRLGVVVGRPTSSFIAGDKDRIYMYGTGPHWCPPIQSRTKYKSPVAYAYIYEALLRT